MNETVVDFMQPCTIVVAETDTVAEAAGKMVKTGRQELPVVDQYGGFRGLLNGARLPELKEDTITQAIQGVRLIVGPNVSPAEVAMLMRRAQVDYAVVLDRGQLIGEVSRKDVESHF